MPEDPALHSDGTLGRPFRAIWTAAGDGVLVGGMKRNGGGLRPGAWQADRELELRAHDGHPIEECSPPRRQARPSPPRRIAAAFICTRPTEIRDR